MIKYKNIKFNGSSLDKVEWNVSGFIITDLQFRYNSQADIVSLLGRHWSVSSPTYVRSREISIKWIITADTDNNLQTLVNELADTLSIDYSAEDEWTKIFEFTDDNDTTWEINARVKQIPHFRYSPREKEVSYSCILFSSDPVFIDKNDINNKRLY